MLDPLGAGGVQSNPYFPVGAGVSLAVLLVWSIAIGLGAFVPKVFPDDEDGPGVGTSLFELAMQLSNSKHVWPASHSSVDPSGQAGFTLHLKAASTGSAAQTLTFSPADWEAENDESEDDKVVGAFDELPAPRLLGEELTL
jgi:hypothetical protein